MSEHEANPFLRRDTIDVPIEAATAAVSEGLYVKGERVYVRHTYGLNKPEWRSGIITDLFIAPITGDYVYVVGGNGYYPHEVRTDDGNRDAGGTLIEPQSIRA